MLQIESTMLETTQYTIKKCNITLQLVWSMFIFTSLFRYTMRSLSIINYFCIKKILFRNKEKKTEKQ